MIQEPVISSFFALNVLQQLDKLKHQFNNNGFVAVAFPAIRQEIFHELGCEASQQRSYAWLCYKPENKGVQTAQHNHRAELGPLASAFLTDTSTLQTLNYITSKKVTPSFSASCYTYYKANDFLGIHTDRKNDCRVTLLLYIDVSYSGITGANNGLSLNLYEKTGENNFKEFLSITPCNNFVFLLKGSEIYHGRNVLQAGESVSLLSLCYGTEK